MLSKTVVTLLVSSILYVQCAPQYGHHSTTEKYQPEYQQPEEKSCEKVTEAPGRASRSVVSPQPRDDISQNTAFKVGKVVYGQQNQAEQFHSKFDDDQQVASDVYDDHDVDDDSDALYAQSVEGSQWNQQYDQVGYSTDEPVSTQQIGHGQEQSKTVPNVNARYGGYHDGFSWNEYHQQHIAHGNKYPHKHPTPYHSPYHGAQGKAKYHFGYQIDDEIEGGYIERREQRENGKVSGYYVYDDGHVLRKVSYVADEYGFRVISDDVAPSRVKSTPNGIANVKVFTDDASYQYAVKKDQIPKYRGHPGVKH